MIYTIYTINFMSKKIFITKLELIKQYKLKNIIDLLKKCQLFGLSGL